MDDMKFLNLANLPFYQFLKYKERDLFNYKKDDQWQTISSFEFLQNVFFLALALKNLGVKKNSKFAIYSYQNPIWLIADFAAMLAGCVTIPIFHNISKRNLLFQLQDCEADFLFIDNQENFAAKNNFDKLDFAANELPDSVQNLITYNCQLEKSSAKINDFDSLIAKGRGLYEAQNIGDLKSLLQSKTIEQIFDIFGFCNYDPKSMATIVYTSGSTGNPKGVELSHDNLVSQINDAGKCFNLGPKDKALSFLPLAHIFERMVMMFYITSGVKISFVDEVGNLGLFMKEVQPTVMTVVPRVLEKVFAKIKKKSTEAPALKRFIANSAINRALIKGVASNKGLTDRIFNKMVYAKYRESLGGQLQLMICGGAALSEEMECFYRNIGIELFCGYGLTETSPVLSVNFADNYKFGSVGKGFDSVALKIADDGELLAKGRGVMMGYHNDPEKTQESIRDDWFKTGDLATIDDKGYVTIVGRKKELFKTSNGKYVRPIPIEQKIVQELGFLTGALIIAEQRNFVSVLLFPDFDLVVNLKKELLFSGSDDEFIDSEELHKYIDIKISSINNKLDRAEQIFQFRVSAQQITIANGGITPSMKLRRSTLEQNFSNLINDIYKDS